MTHDPNALDRLVSSTEDSALRALLEAGREELPRADQLAALAAKLGPIVGPGGAGHGGAAGGKVAAVAGKKLLGAAVAKVVAGAALATVLGISVAHVMKPHSEGPPPPAPAMSVALPATASPTPPEPPASPPSPTDSAAPPAPSAPPRAASSPRAAASADDPDAEVQLLQRAQDALTSNPAQSLALASEHARRFPKGMLAQEREVLAIEALMNLGRASDARARADRFRATYPSSTHLPRIDAVLAGKP